MISRNTLIITGAVSALVLGGGGALFYMNYQAEGDVEQALIAFQEGDPTRAQIELDIISPTIPYYKLLLYQSYIERAEGNINESTQLLERANAMTRDGATQNTRLEITLGRALNAYLLKQQDKLEIAIEIAKKINPENEWVKFFEGVYSYMNRHYSEAQQLILESQNRTPLSPWMRTSFNSTFNSYWETTHLARCAIETNQYLAAREELIKKSQSHSLSPKELSEINFLIGLTYLQETADKSPQAAAPFYKMAFSYFEKSDFTNKQSPQEWNALHQDLMGQIDTLFETQAYEDMDIYLTLLHQMGYQEDVSSVIHELSELLVQEIEKKNIYEQEELLELVNQYLNERLLRESIAVQIKNEISSSIQIGELNNLNKLIEYALLFSSNPQELFEDLISQSQNVILTKLLNPHTTPSSINSYLAFLNELGISNQDLYRLAERLVEASGDLWNEPENSEKVIEISTLALELAPPKEQEVIKTRLSKEISQAYQNAIASGQLNKIDHYHKVAKKLGLNSAAFKDPRIIQNHLKMAQKFLNEDDKASAYEQVELVLAIDPNNEEAHLLAGKSAFALGDYKQALYHLENVQTLPEDALEALAVSYYIFGNQDEANQIINQLDEQKVQNSENYLRLGLGLLSNGEAELAMQWLNHIEKPDAMTNTAKLIAAHTLEDWNQVLELYGMLNPPYSNLEGVNSAVVDAYAAKNQIDQAEEQIAYLLNLPPQPASEEFPDIFTTFKEENLDPWDRFTTAGIFYKYVLKDKKKALKYLSHVKEPSPIVLLERGELEYYTQRYRQAVNDFKMAYNQTSEPEVSNAALPLLASTYAAQGDYAEAYEPFLKHFNQNPDDVIYRSQFAETLMQLGLYPEAKKELEFLRDKDLLTNKDAINYLAALINSNDFKSATDYGRTLLNDPNFSEAQKMRIARTLLPTTPKNPLLTSKVQEYVHSREPLNPTLAYNTLNFLLDLGDYANAETLVKRQTISLEQTPEGLFSLSKFYHLRKMKEKALLALHKAIQLAPENMTYKDFYSKLERDPRSLEAKLNHLSDQIHNDDATKTQMIEYGRDMDLFLNNLVESGIVNPKDMQADWSELNTYLLHLHRGNPEFPEILLLLGRTYTELKEYPEALKAFAEAISLNPSYADAYISASEVYITMGRYLDALPLIRRALKFEPYDASAWSLKAIVDQKLQNIEDVITDLHQALKYNPYDFQSNLLLGQHYLEVKNPEEAKEYLETAVKARPTSIEALSSLLECLYDPFIEIFVEDKVALDEERANTYQLLYQVDPDYAEKVLTEIEHESHRNYFK